MRRRTFLAASTMFATFGVGAASLAQDTVKMRDLYNNNGSFSDFAMANDGKAVRIGGFMAPPLKAESSFFVLTTMPMAVCPFCESEADWPRDIVSIYARDIITVTPFNVPIAVAGTLRLGTYTDEELKFVSRVRVTDAEHWRV